MNETPKNTFTVLNVKDRFDQIVLTVCKVCEVKPTDVLSKKRPHPVACARFMVMKFCMTYIENSTTISIGKLLNRDHSTVVVGLQRIDELIAYHADDRKVFNECEKRIRIALGITDEPEYYI